MTIFLHFNFGLVPHFMYFYMCKYCLLPEEPLLDSSTTDIDTQYSIFYYS